MLELVVAVELEDLGELELLVCPIDGERWTDPSVNEVSRVPSSKMARAAVERLCPFASTKALLAIEELFSSGLRARLVHHSFQAFDQFKRSLSRRMGMSLSMRQQLDQLAREHGVKDATALPSVVRYRFTQVLWNLLELNVENAKSAGASQFLLEPPSKSAVHGGLQGDLISIIEIQRLDDSSGLHQVVNKHTPEGIAKLLTLHRGRSYQLQPFPLHGARGRSPHSGPAVALSVSAALRVAQMQVIPLVALGNILPGVDGLGAVRNADLLGSGLRIGDEIDATLDDLEELECFEQLEELGAELYDALKPCLKPLLAFFQARVEGKWGGLL